MQTVAKSYSHFSLCSTVCLVSARVSCRAVRTIEGGKIMFVAQTLSEMVMSSILLVAVAGFVMAKSQLLKTSHEKGNRSPTDAFCSVLYLMAILND